jgi:predicted Zn-dependent protease
MQLRPCVSLLTVLIASGNLSIYGQFHLPGKEKDKSEEMRQREEKRDAKNLRAYEKIKTYSHNKYETDPDFRDEVDDAYTELLRQHTDEAYERNINHNSRIWAVHEDRFRLHSGLYDNLLVQDDINRIGQSLVPVGSERAFAFRLLPDPTPTAYTLATGTIYISTGMVSLLESEAQLAYVLGHEMAHVQSDHWKDRVMMQHGLEAYNNDQTKKAERIAVIGGLAGALAGGLSTRSGSGAAVGGIAGVIGGGIAGVLLNRPAVVEWDRAQEDLADKMAFKAMLDSRYDVREVPKLYNVMEAVSSRDSRMTLGFLGERKRIAERRDQAQKLIQEAYKAEIELQLKKGFVGDTARHRNLMAELKRDNGIMAYYHDMFEVARKNLSEATSIRDNDPAAQYYYGKVLELIGRTEEDHRLAVQCFQKAEQYDSRKENFGSHLHYALELIENNKNSDSKLVTTELDNYVTAYVHSQVEFQKKQLLPPNMDTIYEYMSLYGNVNWSPSKVLTDVDLTKVDYGSLPTNPDRTLPRTANSGSATKPATGTSPEARKPSTVSRH